MKVAVIQGGPSPEAEVSRASARGVARALESAGHQALTFELEPQLSERLLAAACDVVFPVVHGTQGEDGCLQGLLEVLGVPYVGSEVRCSAIAADKRAAKLFFRAAGLDVAKDQELGPDCLRTDPSKLLAELRDCLGPALIIKPAQGGSTLGMSRILRGQTEGDLRAALELALAHDDHVLVEEYVVGTEVTCPVLDLPEKAVALPPILVTAQATEWYDFESKYKVGGSRHQCPAPVGNDDLVRLERAAWTAHRCLGARDLSRSDFLLTDSGRLVILELNTLPGMTEQSLFPEAAQVAGLGFAELVDLFVRGARDRGARRTFAGSPLPG